MDIHVEQLFVMAPPIGVHQINTFGSSFYNPEAGMGVVRYLVAVLYVV